MVENYEVIDIQNMCEGGLFREKPFREKLSETDWEQYAGKDVLIKGCGAIPVPTWAYMVVTSFVAAKANKVVYGEVAKPISVYP